MDSRSSWCTRTLIAHTAKFVAALPMIVASWESSDLPLFTPASAPILPTSAILAFESSMAARSRMTVADATSQSTHTTEIGPQSTHTTGSSPKHNCNTVPGSEQLPTGAKVGISFGVIIAVLIVFALLLLYRRHIKRSRKFHQSQSSAQHTNEMEQVGSTALQHDAEPQELTAQKEPQELHSPPISPQELPSPHSSPSASAPPIPFASKPQASSKERHELQ